MNRLPQNVADAIEQLDSQSRAGLFVYDLDRFEQHIRHLKDADLTLWYAVKANPLSAVIQVLAKNGFGFDVASRGELDQVLAQGVSPDRILNTGPAKSRDQLSYFLWAGVQTYVVESIEQLSLLNLLAEDCDFTPQVLLRVQLHWDDHDPSNPLGGGKLTPFGLSPQDWQAIEPSQYNRLNIKGLHLFQWGNVMEASRLERLWQAMATPLAELANQLGIDYQVLDLGGGLGIPYEVGQPELDWYDVAHTLADFKQTQPVESLWMELGRYAIGPYGYYSCEVVERKTNSASEQLVLRGGVNHLMRPAISGQPFPARLLRRSDSTGESFQTFGPLCTGLDKLGEFNLPSDVSCGDRLVFSQCGAYGFSESMPYFLCHELPAEAVIYQGKVTLLRDNEPASSWLR